MGKYVADFETSNYLTNDQEAWVWLWAIYNIETEEVKTGFDIDSFMNYILTLENDTDIYFHNLKFDIEFILPYILEKGFKCVPLGVNLKNKEFSMIVTELGMFYSCTVKFNRKLKINFKDSLKLIPLKVADIPKNFGLDVTKGDCDHLKIRDKNYKPTIDEINYCIRDTLVVGKALKTFLDKGLNKLTIGSNTLQSYKESLLPENNNINTNKSKRLIDNNFKRYFPILDQEQYNIVSKSYYGGLSYVNPKFKNKTLGVGQVYDVNSMYPSILKEYALPFSKGVKFDGVPLKNEVYDMYIVNIEVDCRVKKDKIPCIMIGNALLKNEFLEDTKGEYETLTLTNVDIELLHENYDIYDIIYYGGYMYKSKKGLFDNYIDYHYKAKTEYKKQGLLSMSLISKLFLNSLYGKFGSKDRGTLKLCELHEGVVKYYDDEETSKDTIYVPVASFVTAYGRKKLVDAINNNISRFLYCDTDSIHLLGTEDPKGITVDGTVLGAWDHEMTFKKARYLRQKCYLEVEERTSSKSYKLHNFSFLVNHVKVSGATPMNKKYINLNNFEYNLTVTEGKTRVKRVKGGILLVPTTFRIKE